MDMDIQLRKGKKEEGTGWKGYKNKKASNKYSNK